MKKAYVLKTIETDERDYYVMAKDEAEAKKLMKEKRKAEKKGDYGTHSKQITMGCTFNSSKFKITDIKEMTPKEIVKALFCDEC